jgi:hypothetical protein
MLPEDQSRLKLSSPIVDKYLLLAQCGITTLMLQRKVYEDASVLFNNNKNLVNANSKVKVSANKDTFKYNDKTAAEYQEWKVIKKNRFGRKQERVFGVDSFYIYNSKRDRKFKTDKSKRPVYRLQRDISTIRRICRVEGTMNAFKITWDDDGELIDIEYACEQERDVSEIMAKITFLLSRRADA